MTLEELEKIKALQALKSDNATIGRLGTGIGQALLGIGASSDVAAKAYGQAGATMKAMEPSPIKDLKEVDVEGKPIFMTPDQAVNQQAFQASKAKSSDHPPKEFKNTKTGEKIVIKDTGAGYEDLSGKPVLLGREWVFSREPKTVTHTDFAGNKTTYIIDTDLEKDQTKAALTTKGLGSQMGEENKPISTEEAKARVSSAKKGKEESAKLDQEIVSIGENQKALATTSDSMVFSTTLTASMKSATQERQFTDSDLKNAFGNNYKTFMQTINEWGTGKIKGEIPPEIRSGGVKLLELAKNRTAAKKAAVMKSYGATEGLSERGKSAIKRISGTSEQQTESKPSLKEKLLNAR